MSNIDWGLLIGYELEEAEEYLHEEDVSYVVIPTSAPRQNNPQRENGPMRVIAVRNNDSRVELVCAYENWSGHR